MAKINPIEASEVEANRVSDLPDTVSEQAAYLKERLDRVAVSMLVPKVNEIIEMLNKMYPVGSIKITTKNENPGTYLYGTWVAWGSGKVPVGVNTSESEFSTPEKTGGKKTHTLETNEIPAHTHGEKVLKGAFRAADNVVKNTAASSVFVVASAGIATVSRSTHTVCNYGGATLTQNQSVVDTVTVNATHTHTSVGGNGAHNNLQPYITCYMWKRTL